jgi:hypothetical protein
MFAVCLSLFGFSPRQLVKAGVLTVRDVGSWWLAIPSAGLYMKSFNRGRKAVLTMIRKSKYKEILRAVSIEPFMHLISHWIFPVAGTRNT